MWIERDKKAIFIKLLLSLKQQVLLVQGARQVGKTSFILNALHALSDYPQVRLNLLYPSSFTVNGISYFGRDFFGHSPSGDEFLRNLTLELGPLERLSKPALIFIDEVDQYPLVLEAVQPLAQVSDRLKIVFTGSNLENIAVQNAATGRKCYFDLYPITFREFLQAAGDEKLLSYLGHFSITDPTSDFYHNALSARFDRYLRLGGMPKLIDTYLDPQASSQPIPQVIKDLAVSIEENVKSVLGEKSKLYEYEDVLRKMALLSINTLKYSRLQVEHAGQREAKKLVTKTVGARVAHKIRLQDNEQDLSKYILFDCGLTHYLLCGSDLLKTRIPATVLGILYETAIGNALIAELPSRDDLFYWKSGNKAEVDYLLRSPGLVGIDVKSGRGTSKSLASFALFEPETACIVKISTDPTALDRDYVATLPNVSEKRQVPLLNLPHYLASRTTDLVTQVIGTP